MRISQLESFCKIMELRRLSEAAKALHLTQPALSLQLKDLESFFGTQLLQRTTSGLQPTPAGEIVYEYAKTMVALTSSLHQDIANLESGQALKVMASTSVGNYALPCSIYTFKEKHPGSVITLKVAHTVQVVIGIVSKASDIGLVEGPFRKHPDLVVKGIARDQLLLVVPPGWDGPARLGPADLASLLLIMPERGSGIRETIEESLTRAGINPEDLKVTMEMDSIDAIKSAVSAGHGASILSRLAVRKELHAGMFRALSVTGVSFDHRLSVIYHRHRGRSPLASEFLRFLSSPSERSFC
ncbi:MAG: LysR family transcriptional regulator [Bacillota bacterium]